MTLDEAIGILNRRGHETSVWTAGGRGAMGLSVGGGEHYMPAFAAIAVAEKYERDARDERDHSTRQAIAAFTADAEANHVVDASPWGLS